MKNIVAILCFVLGVSFLYGQDSFDWSFYNIFVAREGNRAIPRFILPDYIRDDYKRTRPALGVDGEPPKFYEMFPIEMRINTLFSYGIHNNTFNIRETYLSLGQTFYNDYVEFTPFLTAHGYFDTHDPDINYEHIKDNFGLYDGGVQMILFDHIFVAARGRATFDINTYTFLIMPHYYDPKNPAAFDTPNYYIPQVLNGAGVRVGVIGNFYELAYSQGDYRHSIPKAAMFRLNLPNTEARILVQHENRMSPEGYHISMFEWLVQGSFVFRYPVYEAMWVNALAEYTWREKEAQYIRLEQGFEWKILNISLRESIHIVDGSKKANVYLEYAVFAKFNVYNAMFSIGFQGATDGRYYLLGNVKL